MRVLVVDDNADILSFIRLLLSGAGHDIETASNARQAFELNLKRPAEVLITDIFMPEQDGLETILEFRARWPQLRIIAMSGGGQVATRDYLGVAAEIGADVLLRKPFEPTELLEALARFSASGT